MKHFVSQTIKLPYLFYAFAVVLALSTLAHAEWHFGIGTGPQLLAIDGEAGLDTAVAPVQLGVDFDFEDMSDFTDAVFGFGGYATDGKWMIQYKIGQLQLESDATKGTRTGATLTAKAEFDYTMAELKVGYPVFESSSYMIRAYSGLRYFRQELDLVITGTGFIGINRNKSIDESWTDVLLGVSMDIPFAEKWNWNINADAGYGGSEGTYQVTTGVMWKFLESWSATLSAQYAAVDYENGTKGNTDWYLYDVDETILGLTILYNW